MCGRPFDSPRRRTGRLCNVYQNTDIRSREALMTMARLIGVLALTLLCGVTSAADYPAPKKGEWVARDFKFHTGETLPEVRLHYVTVGDPGGIPVVVLHGSGG